MEHQSQQSSSSAPPNEPKKFKLDPLSLLLPHERQKQSSSALATARPPKQATPGGGGPQAAFMAMLREQQQQQSTDKAVRPGAVRQTSSMGERSGQRTSEGSGKRLQYYDSNESKPTVITRATIRLSRSATGYAHLSSCIAHVNTAINMGGQLHLKCLGVHGGGCRGSLCVFLPPTSIASSYRKRSLWIGDGLCTPACRWKGASGGLGDR